MGSASRSKRADRASSGEFDVDIDGGSIGSNRSGNDGKKDPTGTAKFPLTPRAYIVVVVAIASHLALPSHWCFLPDV
jgi:hypothetical protein